eukprot:UC4_evm5s1277
MKLNRYYHLCYASHAVDPASKEGRFGFLLVQILLLEVEEDPVKPMIRYLIQQDLMHYLDLLFDFEALGGHHCCH